MHHGFLIFFSGPIESAFWARLPCLDSFTTNDCYAAHPESYRYLPGPIRGKPGSYVPINNPGDLFHAHLSARPLPASPRLSSAFSL